MMRRRQLALAAASFLIFATACPPKSETAAGPAAAAGTDIPIGLYAALTGETATFGNATRDGVNFAVDEINAAGGVLGKKIHLYVEDDRSKPEEAAGVVSKLVTQNNVVVLIGENSSSNSLAAAPIAQQNKVPMVSVSSTNPEVTKKGDFIFRVCFIDPLQGAAIARFARENLKLNNVAILQDVKSDYSVGLAKVFTDVFTAAGGKVAMNQSYSAGDADFRAQLTAIKQSNAQAIFIPGYYTEAGQIAIQARDLGLNQPLLGGDGWDSPKLLEIGGANLEGSYYATTVSLSSPDPATQKFVAAFRAKFNRDPEGLNALGYDAMKVVAAAITKAGKLDKQAIRDQIAATKNFPGASGEITIGPDRNPVKPVPIVVIKNGKTEFLQNVKM
jgi:branched-chain amino acid transport system substrate-binding protein